VVEDLQPDKQTMIDGGAQLAVKLAWRGLRGQSPLCEEVVLPLTVHARVGLLVGACRVSSIEETRDGREGA